MSGITLFPRQVTPQGGGGGTGGAGGVYVYFDPPYVQSGVFGRGFASGSVAVTVDGGIAPYTYVWTKLSGNDEITIGDRWTKNANFSAYIDYGSDLSAEWELKVTDSQGTVATNTLLVAMRDSSSAF